jgi:dolichyl-phosphate beta-glucosyltransferase
MTETTIVVPCHNEARRLDLPVFQRFLAAHTGVSFLFVNDGSTDATLEVLKQLAFANPNRCSVLDRAQNGGKAEAVRHGVDCASKTHVRYIGFWDADLATPLDAIPSFVATLNRRPQVSLVVGTRLRLAGHNIRRRPLRRLLGMLFSRVTGVALGTRLHDTQCGAKLFRNTPELRAAFSQPFGSRWIFDVELIARLLRIVPDYLGSACDWIYELPLDEWHDVAGSKLRRGDFVKAVGELASIWWRYLRPGAPAFSAVDPYPQIEVDPSRENRRAA